MSLLIVLVATPQVKTLGLQWGYVDQPDHRKVHQRPIVRVGGIAIVAATLISLGIASGLHQIGWGNFSVDPSYIGQLEGIIIGGGLFFLIGLADDIFSLSASKRLVLQAIVTSLVWALGVRVEHLPIPFWGSVPTGLFSLPLTFLWLAGVTNAINWMDGLDGLAAGVSGIAASLLAVLCWQSHPAIALLALALAGSTLGFLRYNANPAQLFMGDGGSYFIGFTLASVSTVGLMQQSSFTAVFLPYLVLAVPIIDMTWVILTRLVDRQSPFFADQRHLHHRLLQAGIDTKPTVYLIYSMMLWAGSWAIALHYSYGFLFVTVSSLILIGASQPLWKSVPRNVFP